MNVPTHEELMAIALGGPDAKAMLASMKRKSYAAGFMEGRTGGADGSVGAYKSSLPEVDMRGALFKTLSELKEKRREIDEHLVKTKTNLNILEEVRDWISAQHVLSKGAGSLFHKVVEAGLLGRIFYIESGQDSKWADEREFWKGISGEAHVFVIEHDWASAFKKSDMTCGEIRIPYPVSCFEMVASGRHVCFLMFEDGRQPIPVLQTSHGWAVLTDADVQFIADQARAVCISLDAEVAQAEVVRAPHKLNAARLERGRLPLFDYHIVSLANRSRALALQTSASEHHKRLHWRRGHWRHFSAHKTWIKWMLVGNPDLGFVDKHYRV